MAEARRFFDAIAARYERAYALPRDVSRARMTRVLAELTPNARVLDLGVGTGRELTALLDAGHLPTGLDFSSEMLALCNRRARPIPTVLASFWEPLPFEDASFDAVLALHGTLAHPPGGEEAALARLGAEIARVLAVGGRFVAEVPAPAWLDALDQADPAQRPDRHARRLSPDRFVYEDTVCGVSIEARVLDDASWTRALGPGLEVRVEPLGTFERLVLGRRLR
jgi:SAM-dependent methyltransferase